MGTGGYLGQLDAGIPSTDFSCVTCGESVQYAEETHVVTVVLARLINGNIRYAPLIYTDGDYLWEPNFVCDNCNDGHLEDMRELVRDVPYVEDDLAITNCHICHSGIRDGEVVGIITAGEIQRTQRMPNGEADSGTFVCTTDDPTRLCIGCINKLSSEVVDELWKEPIKQFNECEEGTNIRCWRNGCPADVDNPCASCHYNIQTGAR